jgi:hypothetical protein
MGGFRTLGYQPNTRLAVLVFGLFHGFGLATKLQEFTLSRNGLVTMTLWVWTVDARVVLVLGAILIASRPWRTTDRQSFEISALFTAILTGALLFVLS